MSTRFSGAFKFADAKLCTVTIIEYFGHAGVWLLALRQKRTNVLLQRKSCGQEEVVRVWADLSFFIRFLRFIFYLPWREDGTIMRFTRVSSAISTCALYNLHIDPVGFSFFFQNFCRLLTPLQHHGLLLTVRSVRLLVRLGLMKLETAVLRSTILVAIVRFSWTC